MRLLHTDTLELCTFFGTYIPRYAILSHTWEDEEVTFEDMKPAGNASGLKGYAKIREAAKLARTEYIDYIWIDTCCIDKSSSAELSEAINSMFTWYQKAWVCYAYLSDVKRCPDPGPSKSRLDTVRRSRWFTRGWTLQELIAPLRLVFYDCHWDRINDRYELASVIEETTGIRQQVVTGHLRLSTVSAAEKMSWAAKRETTRAEDIAYCLLGLFDINMPLLYGEGPIKAFTRLQQEFLRGSDDESIFACTEAFYGLLAPSQRLLLQLLPPQPLSATSTAVAGRIG
ncbi:Heterokaryon incompatibility protein (HET) domain containing protein [Rhypophila sp. PSN 637]